jgi:hypothetical protein
VKVQNFPYQVVKFILKAGVEESIVNAPRITDQSDHGSMFKSNLTFWGVCVFIQTDEWCVHDRPFNANFEDKFK